MSFRPRAIANDGDPLFEELLNWLLSHGCSLKGLPRGVLHDEVVSGRSEDIPLLIQHGAEINELAFPIFGPQVRGTPLHAYNGPYGDDRGLKCIRLLLDLGADPSLQNDEGYNVKNWYLRKYKGSDNENKSEILTAAKLIDPTITHTTSGEKITNNINKSENNRYSMYIAIIIVIIGLLALLVA